MFTRRWGAGEPEHWPDKRNEAPLCVDRELGTLCHSRTPSIVVLDCAPTLPLHGGVGYDLNGGSAVCVRRRGKLSAQPLAPVRCTPPFQHEHVAESDSCRLR